MRRRGIFVAALVVAVADVTSAHAQSGILGGCASAAQESTRRFCNLTEQAIEITLPRIGLAYAGGNPVAGTASTMGRSLGTIPRFSVTLRGTGVFGKLPPLHERNNDITLLLPSANLDLSLGILTGMKVAPTVGGLGSVDILASVGVMPVPSSKGFQSGSAAAFSGGLRVGILRESFTAPGISVSGMFRKVTKAIEFGSPTLSVSDSSYFKIDEPSVLSFRGVVNKRLLFIGAAAGLGFDRYSTSAAVAASTACTGTTACANFRNSSGLVTGNVKTNRTLVFGNLSWTMLVLSVVAEGGYQKGGKAATVALPANTDDFNKRGAPFGSIALRITL